MTRSKWIATAGAALALVSVPALAQVPKSEQPQNETQRRGAAPVPQSQEPGTWEHMSHMDLEAQFAGPMKDTAIQRWRDPSLNVVCYLYVPFTAQHSAITATGYVQYGANTIGTISCVPVLSPPAKPPEPSAKITHPSRPIHTDPENRPQ